MSIIVAPSGPSPNTVWVAFSHRGHDLQSAAASRSDLSVGWLGIRVSAESAGFFMDKLMLTPIRLRTRSYRRPALVLNITSPSRLCSGLSGLDVQLILDRLDTVCVPGYHFGFT